MDSLRVATRSADTGLRKELGLLGVYALATGATISSGFFLLPGLAAETAGRAITLAYLIAVIPLIPATFSMVELSTAMPRAGGAYYFLDRSMGPLVGTVGGLGTWLALMLKTGFALIGLGAYLNLYFPAVPVAPAAAGFAVVFTLANLLGAQKAGRLQILMVVVLLGILSWFIAAGIPQVESAHFEGFFDAGPESIVETAGLVYISYVGVTKIASVAEEVKDPERNLPIGVFLAVATAVLVYGLGTLVIVGVLPLEKLVGDLHPVADTAEAIAGPIGRAFVSFAAVLAFMSVANAGILSSSRYPLAMSRDHLMPRFFLRLTGRGIPITGLLTTLVIILALVLLVPVKDLAKLASAFQLLLFAFLCLAVVVMRESGIDSYDPGMRSPFYPWMQIFGVLASALLVLAMGWLPGLFTVALLVLGTSWYFYYARARVVRHGAIYHVFERLGRRRSETLDAELRGILREKGLREKDPFDEVIARAAVLDIRDERPFEAITREASELLAQRIEGSTAEDLTAAFLRRNVDFARTVIHGAEIPHLRLAHVEQPEMVIVRSVPGVRVREPEPGSTQKAEPAYALLFLVSPEEDPAQHLRILAQIATHLDDDAFVSQWQQANEPHELKEILLRDERFVNLELTREGTTSGLIGKAIREVPLHGGCLIALVRRDGESIIPDGNTVLRDGDLLTVIGQPRAIRQIYHDYIDHAHGGAAK